MPDISKFDSETKAYFDSLTKFLQENILQSDTQISCKCDLVDIAKNMMQKNDSGLK